MLTRIRKMPPISVQIMTFHREVELCRAVHSVIRQRGIDPANIEILVVDNSIERSAERVAVELSVVARVSGYRLRYVHEPRPGIAEARNAGVRNAGADLIAFLDDDEEADPDWLANMIGVLEKFDCDAVCGPVMPTFEDVQAATDPFWVWMYNHDAKIPSGSVFHASSTANCLFYKSRCCPTERPFDPALGLTGGEDARFFCALDTLGIRVLWCAEGIVREFVPVARTQLAFGLHRRMRQSQLFVQSFTWCVPSDRASIAKWMAIGIAQVAVYSLLSLLIWLWDPSCGKRYLAKAYGGMGKVIWSPRFTALAYGVHPGPPLAGWSNFVNLHRILHGIRIPFWGAPLRADSFKRHV